MAQQGVEKVGLQKHNYARTGRMAAYGGCMSSPPPLHSLFSFPRSNQPPPGAVIFGPAATTWFAFLARRINIPQSPNLTILARVAVDQTVFASTNMFVFLSTMALLEGNDPREKLRKSYFDALKMNWALWPAVQAVNFKFVPLEGRVLVVNVVSLGWNCYLSFLNSQG